MTGYLATLFCSFAFATVLVLPGFGLRWVFQRAMGGAVQGQTRGAARNLAAGGDVAAPAVLALALSVVFWAFVGGTLLALELFSAPILAIVAVAASVPGIGPFVTWLRKLKPKAWPAGVVAALTLPWLSLAVASGFPPAATLRWYYWDLGRQLETAGGVPSWVTEFDEQVRWLPDYVFFNVATEAYRALAVGVTDSWAMASWTVPVVFFTLALVYLMLRLWFRRVTAIGGLIAVAGTTFFLTKFNAYKPEAIGTTLGLAGIWLLVRGLRHTRLWWILLAGALFGVAVGFHGIAAAATGLLALSAGVVECMGQMPGRRLRLTIALALAGASAILIVLVTGWTLQGRLLVASAATNPVRIEGTDPTWRFLQHSSGLFNNQPPPPLDTRVLEAVGQPWPGVDVTAVQWMVGALLIAAGLTALVLLGNRIHRRGASIALAFIALLLLGMALFALGFSTYIPQHTGIARLGDYLGLAVALAAAGAFEGVLLLWERRAGLAVGPFLAIGVTAFMLAWTIPVAFAEYSKTTRIRIEGLTQLATLEQVGSPSQGVMANVGTRGSIEFFSGLENPLEGRQPLIEDVGFLTTATDLLEKAHSYFRRPERRAEFLQRLGVEWLLVADDPRLMGTSAYYGGRVTDFENLPYLTLRARERGISLFQTNFSPDAIDRLGPAEAHPLRLLGSILLLVVAIGLPGLLLTRRAHKRAVMHR